jgi:hypothetical protein
MPETVIFFRINPLDIELIAADKRIFKYFVMIPDGNQDPVAFNDFFSLNSKYFTSNSFER